jgi:plastocyanin
MRRLFRRAAGLAVAAGFIAGCSGAGGGSESPSLTITKQAGDAQTATVGTLLPIQLRVVVQKSGSASSGHTVSWTPAAGSVNPTSSVTDGSGEATTSWTLGTTSGAQVVTATAAASVTATFSATAAPGPAVSFQKESGDGQSIESNSPFPSVLAAKVADQFGNGIEGVLVNWSLQSGSVILQSGSSSTNSQGLAAMPVTAGPNIGPAVVRATTAAVGANVDFDLTVTTPPVRISVGNIFFRSAKNGSQNPAVDTVGVGDPVRWIWSAGSHSVRSTGMPPLDFPSSASSSTPGNSYTINFPRTGTYQYNCGVHDNDMTGSVVVQ